MRLGIMGTGQMAAQMVQAAKCLSSMSVTAVLSRSSDRADAFCAALCPAAARHTDRDAFFAACDVIYIATPPAHHRTDIEAALAAGRPVLCEKPLTLSPEDSAAVFEKAQAAGLLLMEAIWTLALPAYQALAARLETLSSRSSCRFGFDFSYPLSVTPNSHYFDPDTGGVLLDRGVYFYAAALQLLGPAHRQDCDILQDETGTDRSVEIRLEHGNGARSIGSLSFDRLGPNEATVAHPEGLMRLGPHALSAETLSWTPMRHHGLPLSSEYQPAGLSFLQKLKSQPMLRKLKSRLPGPQPAFHGYGASQYAPILQDFATTVSRGQRESRVVPAALSLRIANLVAEARRGRDTR